MLAYVRSSEQKLAIQIGGINRVHINDVNVHKTHHRQILHDFAAEATGTDDQYFELLQSTGLD